MICAANQVVLSRVALCGFHMLNFLVQAESDQIHRGRCESIAVNRSSPGATKGRSEATVTATRGGASAPIEVCGRQHMGHFLNPTLEDSR